MPANVSVTGDDALTLDMVGQYSFCPRRFHLMYVEGRWADNQYTVEGRHVHRRVDRVDHLLPEAEKRGAKGGKGEVEDQGDEPPVVSRSVPLASAVLGLTAKLDLVSSDGNEAAPVETKRGRVPSNAERCYDTQRIQLMAQGLLLREQGYRSDHGMIYFAGSRSRVTVPFTAELEQQTRDMIVRTQAATHLTVIPDPLEDSPKCVGCSVAGICMPDETRALREISAMRAAIKDEARVAVNPSAHGETASGVIRRLYPSRPTATPLYVQHQGAYVSKRGESLIVKAEGEELSKVGTKDVSQLVLCGNVQVSTQTMHLLLETDIPVVYFSSGMWFYGTAQGMTLRNAYDRAAQFSVAADSTRSLAFARAVVRDKALNQKTQLRRNGVTSPEVDRALRDIDDLLPRIEEVDCVESLLGIEGNIARAYFSQFSSMVKPREMDSAWDFNARNRRPPKDPMNAMLSFAYALLAKECTVALLAEGLDPYWGFYHRPRHGRPALALDLMEPLRPIIADSAVITAINTGMVNGSQFTMAASACCMDEGARKGLLRAYEGRLDQLITHPAFEYRCSWRSAILLQARLLSRWLRGDIDRYINIVTR